MGSKGGKGNGASPSSDIRRRLHVERGLKCRLLSKVKDTPLDSDHSSSRTLNSLMLLSNIRYNEMTDWTRAIKIADGGS